MTALDRTFIKAFRRREAESDRPQPPELVVGVSEDIAAPPLPVAEPEAQIVFPATPSPDWRWPAICDELSRGAADGFAALATEIEELSVRAKKSVVALAGSQPRVGCTSVFLTLARTLAVRASRSVLLIEANGSTPALRDHLRVDDLDSELPRTLDATGLAIASLIESTNNVSEIIARYADEYPLILIDAGCVAGPVDAPFLWSAGVIDTAILIDYDDHDIEQRNLAVEYLAQHAGMFLGVIETRRDDLPADVALPRMIG